MQQAEAFKNLYYKTLEANLVLNYILIATGNKERPSSVSKYFKDLSDLLKYIKKLLENQKNSTKLDHVKNNDYLLSIYVKATVNHLCNSRITKTLTLLENNDIKELLRSLIDNCDSLILDISSLKKVYLGGNYYHNMSLEFEESWLKLCSYIKTIHVLTNLIQTENQTVKLRQNKKNNEVLLLTQTKKTGWTNHIKSTFKPRFGVCFILRN